MITERDIGKLYKRVRPNWYSKDGNYFIITSVDRDYVNYKYLDAPIGEYPYSSAFKNTIQHRIEKEITDPHCIVCNEARPKLDSDCNIAVGMKCWTCE